MADLPYMPMFVDDYEAATAHLTLVEDGAYNRLLRLCWRTPGCSIPSDPAWIARKMRVDQAAYEAVVAPIIAEFFDVRGGRVSQKRLSSEFARSSALSNARKTAGKKGGIAKAMKNKDNDAGKAKILPKQKASKTVASIPRDSDTNVSGADAPPDLAKMVFDQGVALLCGSGITERSARAILAKWSKERGDQWTLEAIISANGKADPVSWITARAKAAKTNEDDQRSSSSATAARYREMNMPGPPAEGVAQEGGAISLALDLARAG